MGRAIDAGVALQQPRQILAQGLRGSLSSHRFSHGRLVKRMQAQSVVGGISRDQCDVDIEFGGAIHRCR
jgi:hypothetical protein